MRGTLVPLNARETGRRFWSANHPGDRPGAGFIGGGTSCGADAGGGGRIYVPGDGADFECADRNRDVAAQPGARGAACAVDSGVRDQRSFMNCNDAQELSPLYRAGELDAERAAALAAHLAGCRDCARDVELDERLSKAVLAEPVDTSRADLAIRRGIDSRISLLRVWIAAGVAAMLVVALVISLASAGSKAVFAAAAQDHRREVIDHEKRTWFSQPDQLDALAARQEFDDRAGGDRRAITWSTPSCAG